MSNATANKVSMVGFVVLNKTKNSVVFFGSRTACRDYRKSQKNIANLTGPQSVKTMNLILK